MAARNVGSRLLGLSAFFFSIPTVFSTPTLDNGKLLSVNGIDYYSGGDAVSTFITSANFNSTQFEDVVPITVIRTDQSVFTKEVLSEIISNYSATDDVFQSGFLESRLSASHGDVAKFSPRHSCFPSL